MQKYSPLLFHLITFSAHNLFCLDDWDAVVVHSGPADSSLSLMLYVSNLLTPSTLLPSHLPISTVMVTAGSRGSLGH